MHGYSGCHFLVQLDVNWGKYDIMFQDITINAMGLRQYQLGERVLANNWVLQSCLTNAYVINALEDEIFTEL